ncbi:unnamed protein product [marine sediment metagenome]|uniref:Uncharacterized protein n=1 Tax=marine sediment metagenome TaxID=412755 RepID=X1FJ02_9ZZZZ
MSINNSKVSGLRARMLSKVINNAKNGRNMICIDNIKQKVPVRVPQVYFS